MIKSVKILFAHDHKFRLIEGKYYSTGGLSDEVLSRYSDIFGSVDVLSRVVPRQAGDEILSEIKNPDVKITAATLGFGDKAVGECVKNSDAVIARLPSVLGNRAIDWARRYKRPYLVEMVACPWDGLWNHSFAGKLVAPYLYYATRRRVENAPFTLYVTSEFLQSRYPARGMQTGCSDVALREIGGDVLRSRLRKICSKREKIILGTIGAVDVRYKGQRQVIRALGELKKLGHREYEYQLVGSGDQGYLKWAAEKHRVSGQVKFLGSLPHDEVFRWLDTVDIYVHPSRQEGLPRALIEAMSRGVPTLGAKTGGIPELLEPEYIFSNSRDNFYEICAILLGFDEARMIQQAERNLQESSKYEKNLIEERRNTFFQRFKESVEMGDGSSVTCFAQYEPGRDGDISDESLQVRGQGPDSI